ncbi:3-phytase [Massarina eburnea CBS 473.64]|uniref:3-phytase n=1 Tax=Massarina eburnea CBS 473.64 TaxID=1395130 RepID=A0A6A6RMJ4_9PLEO|nr:3-phytase [Massarina eburnea CBS 473.64]
MRTSVIILLELLGEALAFNPLRAQEPITTRELDSDPDPIPPQTFISEHFGQLSAYRDLSPSYFNVSHVGLPDGCRVAQVHLLQRHAERFPHPDDEMDGLNIANFTKKVNAAVTAGESFSGPLSFLNAWSSGLGGEFLTNIGALSEISAGAKFWNEYGRALYGAERGQLAYRESDREKDKGRKPLLRGTSQSRIHNSLLNWGLGFFGPSWQEDASFQTNWTDVFHTVVMPEGKDEKVSNNTLAAHHCCNNAETPGIGDIGDTHMLKYGSHFYPSTSSRLATYLPQSFSLSAHDLYAMQLLCAYETAFLGSSPPSHFCTLFTTSEWQGFEQMLDIRFFYNQAFGNPTGRALGVGYVEEMLARIKEESIGDSWSSVNSSLTGDAESFPLGMKFYADFTHDKMVLGVLTALSLDAIREVPDMTSFPPREERVFMISRLVPFAAHLVTEVVECGVGEPVPVERQYFTSSSTSGTGNKDEGEKYRFVRMRLNNAILPLSSIRGDKCKGRPDELCPLDAFLESQKEASERAAYQEACFGEYEGPKDGRDVDGTVPK